MSPRTRSRWPLVETGCPNRSVFCCCCCCHTWHFHRCCHMPTTPGNKLTYHLHNRTMIQLFSFCCIALVWTAAIQHIQIELKVIASTCFTCNSMVVWWTPAIINYSMHNVWLQWCLLRYTLHWTSMEYTTNLVVKIFFKLHASLSHTVGPAAGKCVHHLGNSNRAIDSNTFVQQLKHAFKTRWLRWQCITVGWETAP